MRLTRRALLTSLLAAPFVRAVAPALMFRRDAFALVMRPMTCVTVAGFKEDVSFMTRELHVIGDWIEIQMPGHTFCGTVTHVTQMPEKS